MKENVQTGLKLPSFFSMSGRSNGSGDRRGDRDKHQSSPTRGTGGSGSFPGSFSEDSAKGSKESGIFNLFRERGMLGGSFATGSPGSPGGTAAGVYNPVTFKVEPAPEQNIRNILLSNQHTIVSHDAAAYVDESDYSVHYGLQGAGVGVSIYNSYRDQEIDAWNSAQSQLTDSPSNPPQKTQFELDGGTEMVNSGIDTLSIHSETSDVGTFNSTGNSSSQAAANMSPPASALELLLAAVHAPLPPSQQAVIITAIRGNILEHSTSAAPVKKGRNRGGANAKEKTQVYKVDHNSKGEPVGASLLLKLANIGPDVYPSLVETSPVIAYECISNLLRSDEAISSDYLASLVSMETSLQTMEVVNRLITVSTASTSAHNDTLSADTDVVPVYFIYAYVSNCIKCCESHKDKYMQNRLVRLVCAFLQSLIRNSVVNIRGCYADALAFCIEFSKIKEAAALLRMLKAEEGN